MAVKISPVARQQFVDANGVPYSGALLFTYATGSTTKQTTYTDSTGNTANSNPIELDSSGRTPYGLWLTSGLVYKYVFAPSTDTDPPTSPIFTEDGISGVNDTSVTTSEWKASGFAPTYISTTQFSVIGDQTTEFHVNRRLKLTESAGTVYGYILTSAYTTLTTITVVLDSGTLDSGLSAVELGVLSALRPSIPTGILTGSILKASQAVTTVASASSVALASTTQNNITGTTPIATFTGTAGLTHHCKATAALPLTYSAGLDTLQAGIDITLVPGTTFDVYMVTTSTCEVRNILVPSGGAFSAYLPTATQSVTTNTYTKVALSAEEFDSLLQFDKVTNYRFTGGLAGYYMIMAQVTVFGDATFTGGRAAIYKNGVAVKEHLSPNATATNYITCPVSAVIYLDGTITDYIELFGFCTAGTNPVFLHGSKYTFMCGTYLGAW